MTTPGEKAMRRPARRCARAARAAAAPTAAVLAACLLAAALLAAGCGSSSGASGAASSSPVAGQSAGVQAAAARARAQTAAQALVGKRFPIARAKDLTGTWVSMPNAWRGAPLIVLVTPSKASQPDADKWIAVLRRHHHVLFRETPIIDSGMAHLMSGFIKGEMKGGLPKDMWKRVIPVFAGAGAVKQFFGDLGDTVAWVTVLDDAGVIRWMHVGGFSGKAEAAAEAQLTRLQ